MTRRTSKGSYPSLTAVCMTEATLAQRSAPVTFPDCRRMPPRFTFWPPVFLPENFRRDCVRETPVGGLPPGLRAGGHLPENFRPDCVQGTPVGGLPPGLRARNTRRRTSDGIASEGHLPENFRPDCVREDTRRRTSARIARGGHLPENFRPDCVRETPVGGLPPGLPTRDTCRRTSARIAYEGTPVGFLEGETPLLAPVLTMGSAPPSNSAILALNLSISLSLRTRLRSGSPFLKKIQLDGESLASYSFYGQGRDT